MINNGEIFEDLLSNIKDITEKQIDSYFLKLKIYNLTLFNKILIDLLKKELEKENITINKPNFIEFDYNNLLYTEMEYKETNLNTKYLFTREYALSIIFDIVEQIKEQIKMKNSNTIQFLNFFNRDDYPNSILSNETIIGKLTTMYSIPNSKCSIYFSINLKISDPNEK